MLRVRAADALSNARSTLADLRRYGPETWGRFHAGAVDQLWYYRSLSIVLSARLPGLLSDELRVAVRELERLAGWWFDVGDPQAGGDWFHEEGHSPGGGDRVSAQTSTSAPARSTCRQGHRGPDRALGA